MKKIILVALLVPVFMLSARTGFAQSTIKIDALSFVLSNEAPGYLIDNLIASGFGHSSLYAALVALQPSSGGIISDTYLAKLAACPANSDVFTAELFNFSDPSNNPVAIGDNGNLIIAGVYGRDCSVMEGYSTYNDTSVPVSLKIFTSANGPEFYIDAGANTEYTPSGVVTTYFKAFAIAWSLGSTFVLSNEAPGYLIDNMITNGYGNKNLFQVLQALQPASGGVIPEDFISRLSACPPGSDIFTASLSNFAGLNNPVCINIDGTFGIQPIFGKDYFGQQGYSTYPEVGSELFTYATSLEYYIDAGERDDGARYMAFAIAWSNSSTPKAITVTTNSGQSKTFGEEDPLFSYTVQPALDAGDSFIGALSREPGENPGTYAITLGTLSAGAKYAITFVSADFTINPASDAPTTFVLSNEAPGYLIDNLIAAGHGSSSLYDVLVTLKPASGGVISQEFLDKLASCPAGFQVFTSELSDFGGLNNPVGINSDGSILITPLFGKDYFGQEGFSTHQEIQAGVGSEWFTCAKNPQFFIDTGWSIDYDPFIGQNYKAFAIAWSNSSTPKAITVTADSGQKVYGAADPVFTYTFQPALDAGDSFTGALSRDPGEAPGTYAITLGTLSASAKYAITFVSADFTITTAIVNPTTFVLSNEAPGKMIDRLIESGYENSSLYEVTVALKPISGGVITDAFIEKLAKCPSGSDIFSAPLWNFSNVANNPICINTDGTIHVSSIYGNDYYQLDGYNTNTGDLTGTDDALFTFAANPEHYIDAGSGTGQGGPSYIVFAIAWSNSTDGIPDIGLKQDTPRVYPNPFSNGLYVMDLNCPARIEVYNMLGELLIQAKTATDGFISLKNLSNGVYWLRISSTNSVTRQKIVKHQ